MIVIAYSVLAVIALALIILCGVIDKGETVWLLLLFSSVFLCILGYLLTSIADTLEFALSANRIAYLGSVFLPLFMLMMIMDITQIRCPKWLAGTLVACGIVVFAIAASPGYLTIYYSTWGIEFTNGVTTLTREYGPLHAVYFVYLCAYFASMVILTCYVIIQKRVALTSHAIILVIAVFCNIAIWLIEQHIPRGFELLSCSYLVSEILILLLYRSAKRIRANRHLAAEASATSSKEHKAADNTMA